MYAIPSISFNTVYHFCLKSPLSPFISLYEIFRKAVLMQTYTGQIGEQYSSPSHRYYVEKPFADMACTLVWGIGHLALNYLQAHRKTKGEELYSEAVDKNDMALLQKAANEYRHPDAMYLLGTKYQSGNGIPANPQLALAYFKEVNNQRSNLAIGNLYLFGLLDEIRNSDWHDFASSYDNALTYYRNAVKGDDEISKFAQYRIASIEPIRRFTVEQDPIRLFLKTHASRFDTNFPESLELDPVIALGKKFQDKEIGEYSDHAEYFYRCASDHLPTKALKGETFYLLAQAFQQEVHWQKAVEFGIRQAILRFSITKRNESGNSLTKEKEAVNLLLNMDIAVREAYFPASLLLGQYYFLGFGEETAQLDKALQCFAPCLESEDEIEKETASYLIGLIKILNEIGQANLEPLMKLIKVFAKNDWSVLTPASQLDIATRVANSLTINNNQLEPKTVERAKRLYLLAGEITKANDKKAKAYLSLSNLAERSKNVKDQEQYLRLFFLAGGKGAKPSFNMYLLLREKSPEDANHHLELAVKARYPSAMFAKATLLNLKAPKGVLWDPDSFERSEAQSLIQQAAKAGHSPSKRLCKDQNWDVPPVTPPEEKEQRRRWHRRGSNDSTVSVTAARRLDFDAVASSSNTNTNQAPSQT